MGMMEYAAHTKTAPKKNGARRRDRFSPSWTSLVDTRSNMLTYQRLRDGEGKPVLVRFTADAAQMWRRITATGGTPKLTAYSTNHYPARTKANPSGCAEITVTKVSST